MKILYITPGCFDKGGISRYNRYQIQVLREMYGEASIRVLSLLGPDENSFEQAFDTFWHGNGVSLKDKTGLVGKMMSVAAGWRPDLVWVAHVNLSGVAYIAARLSGARTVLNAYGLEIWSKMSKDAAWGLRKVNYIISDCYNTADYLIQRGIRKKEDIEVVWDCIDTGRFVPDAAVDMAVLSKYNIPDPRTHFTILSLGRLSKPDAFYKGYDRLLEVFSGLAPRYPQLRLVFAGRGNYRVDLENMVREKGMQDRVSFTGSVSEEDLVAVYRSCHVFSLITQSGEGKGEGIPLTPLEAMACGKPILVGNEDGSREAVVDNRNGFVLAPADLPSHAHIIEQYLNDPGLVKRQSGDAVLIAGEHFSYARFKERTAAFLDRKTGKR